MLWLHGGSFRIGSANLDVYDGSVLASYGQMVVVSTNYRLGAFGFMNANTSDVPGNVGLWDQYLALRWLHENVGAFGGDVAGSLAADQGARQKDHHAERDTAVAPASGERKWHSRCVEAGARPRSMRRLPLW
ncbi:acetylcholinesterase-1-like [Dermacentor silvarum]|uniref:acetylcholinesterase-1-like n=1 Tax=Dermacentor silvarum TaxID=543639 RepID=UPI002100E4F2|nr:acetylcholinesterase-1-like [Dermacentor silvarum]